MNDKPRTKLKFQIFQHEDNSELVDFTLELTNFPQENLFDFLTSIRDTFVENQAPIPPDES